MKLTLQVHDVVHVIKLDVEKRAFEGSEGRMREPRVGDIGTVVIEYGAGLPSDPVAVESVDDDGFTVLVCGLFSRRGGVC